VSKSADPSALLSEPLALDNFFAAVEKGDACFLAQALERHPLWATAKSPRGDPMGVAVMRNRPECVRALLPFWAATCSETDRPTPLMLAAGYGFVDCLRILLPASNARAVNRDGENALMWAAQNGKLDGVKILLPLSDANQKNKHGATALILAAKHGHAACVSALLPASDPESFDSDLHTAFSWAAKKSKWDAMKVLAETASPLQIETAFLDLAANPSSDALRFLAARCDTAPKKNSKSLLCRVLGLGFFEQARALLPHVDAKIATADGRTPLMSAVSARGADSELFDFVLTLLPRSDLEATDQSGRTALDFAREAGAWACVDLLAAESSIEKTRKTRALVSPRVKLPRSEAKIEREALIQTVAASPSHSRIDQSLPCQPDFRLTRRI